MLRNILSIFVIAGMILQLSWAGTLIGSAEIHAPAVILQTNQGALTTINLNITTGNGNVSILGPQSIGSSTIESAITASKYASSLLGKDFYNYNFTYTILNETTSVSGPSAGAAMTLLAISAFTHKPLRQDFTITGTINQNGTIGEIGGVYDKVSAAKKYNMDFVLVPMASGSSSENELYYLVQNTFGIPLVQVSNISEAMDYAFNSSFNPYAHETYYKFYTNYYVNNLPLAPLSCTNACNNSIFENLTLYTFNFTNREIDNLSSEGNFSNVSNQLLSVLNQARAIAGKGYLYTGADFSFLDYINAYFFVHHNANITSGLNDLDNISNYCYSLAPPQLTTANYEYVLSGELRQAWAEYTINSTIGMYNLTAQDTDGVLNDLYQGAEANGWCTAASFLYSNSANMNGTPISFSQNLKSIAAARLERTSKYEGLYLATATIAYEQHNYALAILDADYAYELGVQPPGNMGTSQLISAANTISANATFGVWPSQYADESRFFAYEASIDANASQAHDYALQAYSLANLALQLSNDTKLISHNMIEQAPIITQQPGMEESITDIANNIKSLQYEVYAIAILEIVAMALFTVAISLLLLILSKENKRKEEKRRK
ncbi:MAG: S16 family serine protease [Candidatus Micrarchaeia archaeon]